ncbi:MAG: hypothetical protein B7Y43_17380 [Sphingomonas sp. 28-62-20]|nr:MAG: hypothetical protein B7Y43_17380 [Sphingomonas sp. 28-62-20]
MANRHFWTQCAPAALAIFALSGCSGVAATGGGVASAPPPPTYPTLASGTGTLSTTGVVENFDRSAGAAVPTLRISPANIEISYNASTQTYSLSGVLSPQGARPDTASYGPAELQAAAQRQGFGYDATTVVNGVTNVSRLQLDVAIPLTYSNIGLWTFGVTRADGSQSFANAYFSYGVQTLANDMPRTGTASYNVNISGTGGAAPLGGSGVITANFGAANLSVALSPTIVFGPTRISQLGTLTGTGLISSNSFAADIAGAGYTGTARGLFYGPQASEIGGAFSFAGPGLGGPVGGAFIGKRN